MDQWEFVDDADEVHRLLLASDLKAASGGPPPQRNPAGTRRLVRAGAVQGLRRGARLVATVTLSEEPTFDSGPECADVNPVLYMRRLSVDPAAQDPLLGLRAVKRAVAYAREMHFRALRSEVNPEVAGVHRMLTSLGFRQRGGVDLTSGFPAVQMELVLDD